MVMQETISVAQAPAPKTVRFARLWRQIKIPLIFMSPFWVVFLAFFIIPIFYALHESLYKTVRNGLGLGPPTTVFAGFDNYMQVLHDGNFAASLGRMLLFGVVQVPIMLLLALALALLMDSVVVRFKSFFRLAFFVPYAIPGIVAALMWGFLYDPGISPIVAVIHSLGATRFDFLGSDSILWSMANIVTWEWTGYNMIIIFAALQAIPQELYEAARVDGSTGFNVVRFIKIPLVAPAMVLTAIFSIIGTLQIFSEPTILRNISTNVSSSYTPNYYVYNAAFGTNNFEYSAALAVVLAVVTFAFSFGFLRVTQRQAGLE
jgi:multiple sugar transport system permease protein